LCLSSRRYQAIGGYIPPRAPPYLPTSLKCEDFFTFTPLRKICSSREHEDNRRYVLDIAGNVMPMSKKVYSYVSVRRKQWCLTQLELASLLPKGGRARVSSVERGLTPPNVGEILAYRLIFGASPKTAFADFVEEIEETVMHEAYKMYRRLEADRSPKAARKRQLLEKMMRRVTGGASRMQV
jgi:hypothetical protein